MTDKIDYFFSIGSPWAYLGLEPFAALAGRHGAMIEPHVIPLIEENGGIYSRNRPPARRAYWIEELKRWAHLRGVPLQLEERAQLSDPSSAGRLIVAAWLDGQDWRELARALHAAFWSRAEDIGRESVRVAVADRAGFDGAALEARAGDEDVVTRLAESLDLATRAGVFGVPTYRHRGALFWGQDSLAFLETHLRGEALTV